MKYKAGQVYMTKFMKKEIMLATINADDFDEKDARILSDAKSYDGYFEISVIDPPSPSVVLDKNEIPRSKMRGKQIYLFVKRQMCIDVWECVRADG